MYFNSSTAMLIEKSTAIVAVPACA